MILEVDALLQQAVDAFNHGRFQEAEAISREFVSKYGNNLKSLSILAKTSAISGRYSLAKAYLEQCSEIDPESGEILEWIADLYWLQGSLYEAIAYYRKAIDKDYNRVSSFMMLSNLIKERKKRQGESVEKWFSDKGDETLRVNYPIHQDGLVLDVGGFDGEWSKAINNLYGPEIYIFEPVKAYCDIIAGKFFGADNVRVINAGLSNIERNEQISVMGNASSTFRSSQDYEEIKLVSVSKFFADEKIECVDLIKINIEGGEYDLIESMIAGGEIRKCKNIQIQFHDFVRDAEWRRWKIRDKLMETHKVTWDYPFVWENWERR